MPKPKPLITVAEISAKATERALYAFDLRIHGKTYRQIGVALGGIHPETARQIEARGARIAHQRWRSIDWDVREILRAEADEA